jgi:hypothetical protein
MVDSQPNHILIKYTQKIIEKVENPFIRIGYCNFLVQKATGVEPLTTKIMPP